VKSEPQVAWGTATRARPTVRDATVVVPMVGSIDLTAQRRRVALDLRHADADYDRLQQQTTAQLRRCREMNERLTLMRERLEAMRARIDRRG
jgi:hypothetical protein